jgi:hypothetical protein
MNFSTRRQGVWIGTLHPRDTTELQVIRGPIQPKFKHNQTVTWKVKCKGLDSVKSFTFRQMGKKHRWNIQIIKVFVGVFFSVGLHLCRWVWSGRWGLAASWFKNNNKNSLSSFEFLLSSYEMEKQKQKQPQIVFSLWALHSWRDCGNPHGTVWGGAVEGWKEWEMKQILRQRPQSKIWLCFLDVAQPVSASVGWQWYWSHRLHKINKMWKCFFIISLSLAWAKMRGDYDERISWNSKVCIR